MYKEDQGSRILLRITILCIAILCSKGSTLSAAENFVECETRWGKVQCQVRTPPDINHCWLFYSPFCLMGSSKNNLTLLWMLYISIQLWGKI